MSFRQRLKVIADRIRAICDFIKQVSFCLLEAGAFVLLVYMVGKAALGSLWRAMDRHPCSLRIETVLDLDGHRPADGSTLCTRYRKERGAMKTAARLLFVLFCVSVLRAQTHAPTTDQCRADQKLWLTQLAESSQEISSLSFAELGLRATEMRQCYAVDDNPKMMYNETAAAFFVKREERLQNFVNRHHLMEQFLAEDISGKR
jgi:hypothetical protein